jgi:UDP-2,3-diacylglucosamine pyrophosphatase LpxH
VKVLDIPNNKYAILSDLHLGDGGGADDFNHNMNVLLLALDYYQKNKYKLILLGDIEELWQFDVDKVVQKYQNSIYQAFRKFGDQNIYRVYGNHDDQWGAPPDPAYNNPGKQPGAPEALRMKNGQGKELILLVHGHQGSTESDRFSWISRVGVRLYKIIEPVIKVDPHTSATKSQIAKDYERIMYGWAKKNKVILICGHSHRAIFAAKSYVEILEEKIGNLQLEIQMTDRTDRSAYEKRVKEKIKEISKLQNELLYEKSKGRDIDPADSRGKPVPCYYNTGCGLYTDGITTIEIAENRIKLVKWHKAKVQGKYFTILNSDTLPTL